MQPNRYIQLLDGTQLKLPDWVEWIARDPGRGGWWFYQNEPEEYVTSHCWSLKGCHTNLNRCDIIPRHIDRKLDRLLKVDPAEWQQNIYYLGNGRLM